MAKEKDKQQSIFGAVFDGPDSIFGRTFDGPNSVFGRVFGSEEVVEVPATVHITLTEEHATRLLAGKKLTYRHGAQTFIVEKKKS